MNTPPALAWVRTHPVLAGALACALVGTANAEYTLATGTHVNGYVALAVPGALDLYVIQALRVHRDVAAAVLVMVAANVASHLLAASLYPAGYWWDFGITAGVGALAPGIVWRVHSLERTRTRTELLWELKAGAADEFFSGAVKAPEYVVPAPAPGFFGGGPEVQIAPVLNFWSDPNEVPVPDSVPEEWSTAEYGDPDAPVPYSESAPDEYNPVQALHSVVLRDSDWEYLPSATEYVGSTSNPTLRGMKEALKVGQDRADRLLRHLGVFPK